METALLTAAHITATVSITLVERDEEFVVEALDLEADYRENVFRFKVLDNRQEAWHYYDQLVRIYGDC